MKNNGFRHALQFAAALAVAFSAAACSGEEDVTPTPTPHKVTVSATQPGARMAFDGSGAGYWQTDDAITVVSENGSTPYFSKFTMTEGVGSGKATFSGTVLTDRLEYAFYPYNENHKYDDEYYRYCFPESYTCTKVGQDYVVSGGPSFNMPMIAQFNEDNQTTASFKHVGCVLAIKIDRMPSETGKVTVTAKEDIAGYAAVGDNNVLASISEGSKTVTFNYSNAEYMKSGVFYLPLPQGTYTSGLTVTVAGQGHSGELSSTYTTTSNIEIVKGHIKKLAVTTDYSKEINGHRFIDLGLASGLLWAETNVGADESSTTGSFFAWGKTTTSTNYDGSEFSGDTEFHNTYSKDGDVLQSAYDAATANWGTLCRMPTKAEAEELIGSDAVTTERENGYCYFTRKVGNQQISLPLSGGRMNAQAGETGKGLYWTGTYAGDGNAYYIIIGDNAEIGKFGHVYGCNVRPVAEP